jgi:hypothetical protein
VLHVLPAQQAWPLAPHASQVMPPSPAWHDIPEPQVLVPPQQRWPMPPHASHMPGVPPPPPPTQTLPVLQVPPPPPPPGQHGWFGPPQVSHIMPPSAPAPVQAPPL